MKTLGESPHGASTLSRRERTLMQNAVVHGLRYSSKYAIFAIAALFCVVAARAASVTVSSGTWSAAGVQAGDAVTVTGSCVNDIDGVQLGSLAVSAASGTTVEITGAAFSFGAGGLTRTGEGSVKFWTDVHGTGPVALSQGPTYVYGATCGLGDPGSIITISDCKSRLFLGGTAIKNSKKGK